MAVCFSKNVHKCNIPYDSYYKISHSTFEVRNDFYDRNKWSCHKKLVYGLYWINIKSTASIMLPSRKSWGDKTTFSFIQRYIELKARECLIWKLYLSYIQFLKHFDYHLEWILWGKIKKQQIIRCFKRLCV